MSSGKKILTVFGATGNQGGSVVKTILNDPKAASQFHVRAVTRDATKPKAKELEQMGAELITADIEDKDTLRKAIKGAWGVYAVTDYWQYEDAAREEQQGKNIADVSKEEGVQMLIFSSLPDVKKITNGKLPNVYHFQSKANVEQYIRNLGIPAVFVMPGFFLSNVTSSFRRGGDGTWTLAMPMPETAPVPIFAPEFDSGKWVKAALMRRDEVLGKNILAATAYYTPKQMLADFQELFPQAGVGAQFFQVPEEMFIGFMKAMGRSDVAALELWENMRLISEEGYYGGESLDYSLSILDEKPMTWKEYAKQASTFEGLQ